MPEATQALRREAVIAAIVAAEEIVPSEDELLEVVTPTAEREKIEPQKLLEDLRQSGRIEDLAEDLAARQAVEWVAEHSKPIPIEQARPARSCGRPSQRSARMADAETAGAQLWTPDR